MKDKPKGRPLARQPYKRKGYKLKRNDRCPCQSGRKWKDCCMNKQTFIQKIRKVLS